jgi:hypothetical protein
MANQYNLGEVITNPLVRKVIYGVYTIIGVALVVTNSAFIGDASYPEWLTIANSVVPTLGVFVGGLAVVNTTTKPVAEPVDEVETGEVIDNPVSVDGEIVAPREIKG